MAKAHRTADGGIELETSDGIRLPWQLGEKRLADMGIELPPLAGIDKKATADNPFSFASGYKPTAPGGSAPPIAGLDDVLRRGTGQKTDVASSPIRLPQGSTLPTESQESVDASDRAAKKTIDKAREERGGEAKKLRGGGELKSLQLESEPQQRGGGGGGSRGQFIPGGDQRVAYSIQKGADPRDLGELKESIDDSVSADTQLANVQTDQRLDMERFKSAQLDDEIKYQEEKLVEGRARIQQIRNVQAERQAEIDAEREKVAALEQDPHNYWASKSTGTKVLSFIAAVVAGAASGYNGRPNEVLARLDRLIAEDMAEHKGRIAARKSGAKLKQDELDKLMEREDPDIAEREVEARKYARTAAMLEKFGLDTGNPAVIAQNRALAAQIRQAAAEKWTAIDADRGDRITEQWQYRPGQYAGGGAPAAKESDVHQYAADLEKAGLGDAEGRLGELNDLIQAIPEGGEIPTFDTRNILSRGTRNVLDKIGGQGTGAKALDSPAERQAAAKLNAWQAAARNEISGASLTEGEKADFARSVDGVTTREGAQAIQEALQRKIHRRKAGIRAGIKPEAVEVYEGRKQYYDLPRRPSSTRAE